jgi:hypothetical protein
MMATSQLSPDNPQIQKGYLSLSILRRDMTMRRIVISVHTDNYALSSKQRAQIQPQASAYSALVQEAHFQTIRKTP